AGQPAGWLNVIVGKSSEIGDVLIDDPRVKLITFTGSSDVGWKLRARAARKKVNLELGNSTPLIVMADADMEKAATAVAANGTAYGLQAGIFTQDISRAMWAAQALDFGGVTVNEAPTWRADHMPYGGVKESGNTREGPKYAVQEMTEPRLVVIGY